jgi:hypothetical protein
VLMGNALCHQVLIEPLPASSLSRKTWRFIPQMAAWVRFLTRKPCLGDLHRIGDHLVWCSLH